MSGRAIEARDGMRGFDCNCPVSAKAAAAFKAHGYDFVARYLPRVLQHQGDLTASEVNVIHGAGMAVIGVQHVESESSWDPTPEKGTAFGAKAALSAVACGLAMGTMVYLDLEGVDTRCGPEAIIQFATNWYAKVARLGFSPGLYVGWHCGLTPDELYALPFSHYWGAYNLNRDEQPAKRGVSMQQHEAKPGDVPPGFDLGIDVDTIHRDNLGGLPLICVPDSWTT